tara:strand:+ start:437 stop:952 length:516 start_codon:yes stop_codon:yes gene_type:complete
MKKLPALVTIITVTLSGCGMQQGDFPSLQKRPYEDEPVMDEAAAPATANSVLSADQLIKLSAAVKSSNSADEQFQAKLPAVKRRVDAARGAAQSSESWVVAHMELAEMEILRSPSVEALADIDALYRAQLEREMADAASGGTSVIIKRRDAVQVQVDRQQAEIDAMKNRLR